MREAGGPWAYEHSPQQAWELLSLPHMGTDHACASCPQALDTGVILAQRFLMDISGEFPFIRTPVVEIRD